MGQRLTPPLSLTLGHWKEVKDRANNLLVEVKERVFDVGPHGHPNQVPHVIT